MEVWVLSSAVADERWVERAASQQTVRAAAVVVVAGVTYLVVVNSKQGQSEQQLKEMEIERGEWNPPLLACWLPSEGTDEEADAWADCLAALRQRSS